MTKINCVQVTYNQSSQKAASSALNVSLILEKANNKKRLVGNYSSTSSYRYTCKKINKCAQNSTKCSCFLPYACVIS